MTRVRTMQQAEALRSEHQETTGAFMMPDITVGPRGNHSVSGTGMDGVEADYAELTRADKALAELHDQLVGQLRTATELSEPLRDGGGPVAAQMRRAFLDRADADGGVQAVLADYIEELTAVRMSIRETLQAYQQVDEQAAAALRVAGEGA
ncbi:hypothetical protein [Actinokineospora sp.]|uniref:hypothetical protein n=1 Tax=Actinokineospora sp. TaxID=1872133 RepID=UPI0040384B6C